MKKKLPEHVTQLKSGKFRVRYKKSKKFPVEYDEVFASLEEAIQHNEEYRARNTLKLNENEIKPIRFFELCDLYLEWVEKRTRKLRSQTKKSYKKYINRLKVAIGNGYVHKMDVLFLTDILDKESKRPSEANGAEPGETISGNTLLHEYTMLKILFKKAKLWNRIKTNPMDEIEPPRFVPKEIEVPEFEELDEIEMKIMKAPIRERLQFLIGLFAGMREEEVAGLHKNRDINYEFSEMNVNTVIEQKEDGSYGEGEPKSKYSKRCIAIPERLLEVVDEYLVYRENFIRLLKIKNPGYVEKPNLFLNKDGDFYRPYRISRLWSKFAKQNDINLTFHGLRHYFITNQVNHNSEINDQEAQRLAGHASYQMTTKYVHVSKKRLNRNATKIFEQYSRVIIHKKGENIYTIPIEHVASIILGKSSLSKVNDLKITLEEMTNRKIDYFNISDIIESCKTLMVEHKPALRRLEKIKTDEKYESDNHNEELLSIISKQFGKEIDFVL